MINALFVICLIITLLVVFRGYRRGLIGIIYGLAAWVFIIIFIVVVSPLIYNSLNENKSFHDAVYNKIYPYADRYVPEIGAYHIVDMPYRLSDNQINGVSIPDEYRDKANDYLEEHNGDTSELIDKIKDGSVSVPEEYKNAVDTYINSGGDVDKAVDTYLNDSGKSLEDVANEIQDGTIEVPDQYKDIVNSIKESGLDLSDMADSIKEGLSDSSQSIRETAVISAAEKATSLILHALAVILSYLIAKIICLIVKIIINIVTETGPIKPIVHVAGAGIGLVEALLYIFIILYVISLIKFAPEGEVWYEQVQNNIVLSYLYDHNMLRSFLAGLLNN